MRKCNLSKIINVFNKCIEKQIGGNNKIHTITY